MAFGLGTTVLGSSAMAPALAGAGTVPTVESGGFWNGLGDVFGGALELGSNYLNGLAQISLANRVAGSPAGQATANQQAAANAAAAQAAAQTSASSSFIAGVPNGVVYGAAALVVVLIILFLVKG